MKKNRNQQPFIIYPPEIEARRDKYRRVGAALRSLLDVEFNGVSTSPDIDPPGAYTEEDEHEKSILYRAIRDHLNALFEDVSRNFGTDFWTTLYVELRLYRDREMLGIKRARTGLRKEGNA